MKITILLILSLIILSSAGCMKIQSKLESEKLSNLNKPYSESVFDTQTALSFLKSLAKLIIEIPFENELSHNSDRNTFMEKFNFCFRGFEDNPEEYDSALKSFHFHCFSIKDNAREKWNLSLFQSTIMTKIANIRVQSDRIGEINTCQGVLNFKSSADTIKIQKLFDSYFKAINPKPKNAKPFISSLFSVHRHELIDGAFINLNKESRGLGANAPSNRSPSLGSAAVKPIPGIEVDPLLQAAISSRDDSGSLEKLKEKYSVQSSSGITVNENTVSPNMLANSRTN